MLYLLSDTFRLLFADVNDLMSTVSCVLVPVSLISRYVLYFLGSLEMLYILTGARLCVCICIKTMNTHALLYIEIYILFRKAKYWKMEL